jgi:hypothetical protein
MVTLKVPKMDNVEPITRKNSRVLLAAEEQLVFGGCLGEMTRVRDMLNFAVPGCLLLELLDAKIARTRPLDLPPLSPWAA